MRSTRAGRLAVLFVYCFGLPLSAAAAENVDQRIDDAIRPWADGISGLIFSSFPVAGVDIPIVLVWLIFAATFFTLYFRFINFRAFRHGFQLVRGDYSDPMAAGEVTHFQALATALSGTVGLGNIAGVAVAVSLGGPGATFWMILAGLLGMSSKFVECTLGVKYRNEYTDGTVSGGPMYYLSKGLAERGPRLKILGKFLAVMFAVFCVGGSFGGGNMFQANQSFVQLLAVTGGESSWLAGKGWVFGLVVAALVGLVVIGGIQGIARVTSRIVPLMAVIYLAAGLSIIAINAEAVPAAMGAIVSGAFSPQGVAGGVVGVLFQGFKRAAFSNEAGIGSAAIAHSAVRTSRPVSEGFVALYEPFIDTVVVCTVTALVIIITGTWNPSIDPSQGVALTSSAFESAIPWFPWVLTIAVVLFAFSTMISWSYYGLKAWTYLFGESKIADALYKILFLAFIVAGSSMQLGSVIDFSDAMIFAMAFPNVLGIYFLLPVVKRELDEYWADYKEGRLPKFGKAARLDRVAGTKK
ncbi:MAG: alanine:cation symporter family protein [Xanthomonadales bacterium]|nr:alanine:cation symporter family protein [Gammaproteobacteria bacterium]MBT8049705.1 alanine:cation symporter family protein [Gammaproteobacteria bacterium]MBT8055697.1 alanine:cation symporter family protein [Gammaproteobacteria bacterium]NNJ78267.1 alanine:cation symporter family protein [Xanthomonadales bacterium]NNL04146.1 alanine:cation symporter family protein [Xanthomonadales bacterium]